MSDPRPAYLVHAEWHEGSWVLVVPSVPAVSQVDDLANAEESARTAIAFLLNVDPMSFDVAFKFGEKRPTGPTADEEPTASP